MVIFRSHELRLRATCRPESILDQLDSYGFPHECRRQLHRCVAGASPCCASLERRTGWLTATNWWIFMIFCVSFKMLQVICLLFLCVWLSYLFVLSYLFGFVCVNCCFFLSSGMRIDNTWTNGLKVSLEIYFRHQDINNLLIMNGSW